MGIFTKKKKPRVCVIGLDGVPCELLLDLSEKDVMPGFKELLQSGSLHKMKASIPEISAISWTDFMTGTNPATHGIFGFTDLKKGSYDLRFPNYLNVKAETIWDTLGKKKKRSIVINQPSTYPARRINGVLISGFVALELIKAVYPVSIKEKLEKLGYQIDIDTFKSRDDHDLLWRELSHTLKGRIKAYESLWGEDWDYFELVITGTDRLQHFLWKAYENDSHPEHQKFLDYYHDVDKFISRIVHNYRKLTGGHEGLYLLSDHGFTSIKQEVYLNAWLESQGYLRFENDEPKNLNEIHESSKAFAMDPNRIYINDRERFPKGSISPGEAAELKKDIKSRLEGLKFEGQKVIREVFDTHNIYSGPLIEEGPDLIALSEYGFDMKGSVKKKEVFGLTNLQGMHTWDNAFFWANEFRSDNLAISDLAGLILEHFS